MTPKRKPLSALARLTASHMRLLKVLRGQIQELGELRKVILDMQPPKEFEVPPDRNVHWSACAIHRGQECSCDFRRFQPNDWPRL